MTAEERLGRSRMKELWTKSQGCARAAYQTVERAAQHASGPDAQSFMDEVFGLNLKRLTCTYGLAAGMHELMIAEKGLGRSSTKDLRTKSLSCTRAA